MAATEDLSNEGTGTALPGSFSPEPTAAATAEQEVLAAGTESGVESQNNDTSSSEVLENGSSPPAVVISRPASPLPPDGEPRSPSPSLRDSPPEGESRNQAPGILDRRKSFKPASRSGSWAKRGGLGGRKGGPPIRVTMADVQQEMEAKDGDVTPEQDSDAPFEDAAEITPRPSSAAGRGGVELEDKGLAIFGAAEGEQSTIEEPTIFNGDAALHSRVPTLESIPDLAPPTQGRERGVSPSNTHGEHLRGLSGDFAVGTLPPPSTADRARSLEQRQVGERPKLSPDPAAGGLARKASSGFAGLLGRMGSIRKSARSPPARPQAKFTAERRGTASSVPTLNGSANGLKSIADALEGTTPKLSLQDQFTHLRRQSEYKATMGGSINGYELPEELIGGVEKTPNISRTRSDAGLSSPTAAEFAADGPRLDRSASIQGPIPAPITSPSVNPELPPGTASGLSAGPADEPRPVNWALWQTLVYEGPTTVKRTSGEELQAAIASGIPPAIRGVAWQVLADSKNPELENVYRTLKARGTDAEQPLKPQPMSRSESQNAMNGHTMGEKDSVSSSRSSVHSEHSSTPATSAMASPPPSSSGTGETNLLDVQGKLLAEKQKRDAASLAKLEKVIRRDMGSRTSYSKYTQSAGLQDGLFGLCKAYALFDEGVGYAQGINFIAMPLLFNMSEEEAFTLLVRLMSKYDLRSMFTPGMAGLHLRLYQFERLLEDLEPALYCHLRRRKVEPQLYATQWFLTLFAYRFPLQLVLRVYDLILSEGLTAILKFGIVVMQRNREALLEMKDMGALSAFLKEKIFDVYIDKSPSASSLLDSGFFGSVTGGADKELYRADEMVRDACKVRISEETLMAYTAEWEEQQRSESARTTELEILRSSTSQLTALVKNLELRTQQQDTEHVTIASDFVNLKLLNDSLLDENEGLKMKVQELQKMVEGQPAEVEGRLREEMERIMGRNVEVQNENRMLKEEVEELGTELVNAKMVCAQARADHDALQQRFVNIQAAING